MPSLVIARSAADVPMGAQVYEAAVITRAAEALGTDWQVREAVARSMRSSLPGTHRLPLSRLASTPAGIRRLLGRGLYPRGAIVHRMSLELPPATHGHDVVTLHDVISWKYADESAPVKAAAEEMRRSAAVVCGSRYTAQEAVSLLGISEPEVVPYGVDERFFDAPALTREELLQLGIEAPYVLASGGSSARKNLRALAAAWRTVARAHPNASLVLSGPESPARTELFRGLPRVHLVGRLPDGTVPGLMAAASVVVVPSLEEGFGLPALEGMAVGTTVVAADTSSLTEVVADGGFLVAPTEDGVASGLVHALSDDPEVEVVRRRGAERARRFTWSRCAQGHAQVWRRVAGTT
jgi:glycosyltransferase involved in cell wall biosynthesis